VFESISTRLALLARPKLFGEGGNRTGKHARRSFSEVGDDFPHSLPAMDGQASFSS